MNIPPWRLVILAGIVSFCANWSFAFQITYVNTSVDTFYKLAKTAYRESRGCRTCTMPESEWLSEWSVVVSMFYPGTIGGFFMVPFLTNNMGIKKAQCLICLAATCGVMVHILALYFLHMGEALFATLLSLGRVMIGLQAGSSLCLLPLYIIEISPPAHRAFLNNFQQLSQSFATLLGLIFGSEEILPLGNARYITMQIIALVPVLFLFFVLIITPPTPNYLKKFKPESAESKMFYFGMDRSESYRPLISNYDFEDSNHNRKYSLRKNWRHSMKGFLIGVVVACSYAFTGDDLIDTFSANMLIGENAPKNVHQSTDAFTILISDALGVVLFIASLIGVYLADRYGRRKLVLTGLFGTCVANLLASLINSDRLFVAMCFAMTKMFIGLGCGGPAWFITSELVDPDYAWIFQPLSTGILLSSTMIETYFYLMVDSLVGSYSLIILAAAPAFVAGILIYLYLPETRGKSYEEIQYVLDSNRFSGIQQHRTVFNHYGSFEEHGF
ncbi:unnamed protein product [Caenorhabditis bovis]|uniref:Major facilitator superfamily (MFS) profile domain-containing protein n=1 Tax=Caenorhabditis bovis TaxID=2654633 RepID=A0A8S1EF32_9PELO|nr:unnamed protein product [Caenorhabditis bovis]